MSRVRPILFNGDMVRAILDGRKTVTRRLVKPQHLKVLNSPYHKEHPEVEDVTLLRKLCEPPCKPGDILYVRETWFYEMHMHDKVPGEPDLPSGRYSHRYVYKADSPNYPVGIGAGANGWRPSIHMPKEAARIWLKVTDVSVERLQEITISQAIAEGMPPEELIPMVPSLPNYPEYDMDQIVGEMQEAEQIRLIAESFGKLWNTTVKKPDLDRYGWEASPWVWAIEFERCDRPEGVDG